MPRETKARELTWDEKFGYKPLPVFDGMGMVEREQAEARLANGLPPNNGYPNFESDQHLEGPDVIDTGPLIPFIPIPVQVTLGYDRLVLTLLPHAQAPLALQEQMAQDDCYYVAGQPYFALGECKVGDDKCIKFVPGIPCQGVR